MLRKKADPMEGNYQTIDAPFVHERALCESRHLGARTQVGAFSHIFPSAHIGGDCSIADHVIIENDVIVGNRVTIKCGVQLWDGLRVGNNVVIGPNATFTNERRLGSEPSMDSRLETTLEDGVSIGANATILPGLRIGRGAMVGAGAVVTRDVPPYSIVVGNPAVITGYQDATDSQAGSLRASRISPAEILGTKIGARLELGVSGCFVERLPNYSDMRGSLMPLEAGKGLPFVPARVFLVYDVASSRVRGEHAHRVCEQFLVAARGGMSVVVDDGTNRAEVRLTDPTVGLYLAPMVWGIQYKFDRDSVLMVMASRPYEAEDYIREYDEFRRLVES